MSLFICKTGSNLKDKSVKYVSKDINILAYGIFCRTDRCGNGNLFQEWPSQLFLQIIDDSFGGIDGGTASNGNNKICSRVSQCFSTVKDSSNRGMLADLPKGGAVCIMLFQNVFNLGNNICLEDYTYESSTIILWNNLHTLNFNDFPVTTRAFDPNCLTSFGSAVDVQPAP